MMADFVPGRLRRGGAPDRGGRDGQPRQDQHPGVRLALLHRARRRAAGRARRGTSTGWPAGRAAAPRPRSPPGWSRSRRAPTAAGRSGSRRAAAGWSGSSRAAGRISGGPMYGDPVGLAHRRAAGPHRAGRRRAARRDGRAGGRATRSGRPPPARVVPRPRATGSPAGCGSPGSPTPVIADAPRAPRVPAGLRGRVPAAGVAGPRRRGHRRAAAGRTRCTSSRPAGRC